MANMYSTAAKPSIPNYGGDGALQGQPDGLASSLKRLADVTQQLSASSSQLRDVFGISAPACEGGCPPASGVKDMVDRDISDARDALDNINAVLEHLRS